MDRMNELSLKMASEKKGKIQTERLQHWKLFDLQVITGKCVESQYCCGTLAFHQTY